MSTVKKAVKPVAKKAVEVTAEVKEAVKPVAAKAAEVTAEVKEEVKEEVKAAAKTVAKKAAPAKKAAAKKVTEAKETVKKAAAKKTTAKKASKAEVKVAIQFADKNYTYEDLAKIANDVWVYDYNKDVADLKDVQLYVKTEESKVYYVFNNEIAGDFFI